MVVCCVAWICDDAGSLRKVILSPVDAWHQIEALEMGKGYILESAHREEMKEIKRKHREELEEVTYQQGKKMEMKKEEMTHKINFLEGEVRKLMFEIKCLNQSNEYGSTSTEEMKDEEPSDIYKINE